MTEPICELSYEKQRELLREELDYFVKTLERKNFFSNDPEVIYVELKELLKDVEIGHTSPEERR